ncbi:hypothetical protein L9F63_001263, partial [Diploptera punctata]
PRDHGLQPGNLLQDHFQHSFVFLFIFFQNIDISFINIDVFDIDILLFKTSMFYNRCSMLFKLHAVEWNAGFHGR